MDRVLQWVASRGAVSSVSVITRSTSSSVTARGRPLRGSSDSPSSLRSRNRERHFPHRLIGHSQVGAHRGIAAAFGTAQNHSGPQRQSLRRFRTTNPPFQGFTLHVIPKLAAALVVRLPWSSSSGLLTREDTSSRNTITMNFSYTTLEIWPGTPILHKPYFLDVDNRCNNGFLKRIAYIITPNTAVIRLAWA